MKLLVGHVIQLVKLVSVLVKMNAKAVIQLNIENLKVIPVFLDQDIVKKVQMQLLQRVMITVKPVKMILDTVLHVMMK